MTTQTIDQSTVDRMVALVRAMADGAPAYAGQGDVAEMWEAEAFSIAALLPPIPDRDLLTAREMVREFAEPEYWEPIAQDIAAALRKAREEGVK